MDIVLQKRLANLSIRDLYEACWTDGNSGGFYGKWLTNFDGKENVNVQNWERRDPQGSKDHCKSFINDWDKEVYQQRRSVTSTYNRDPHTMGYSLGKPVVKVQQVQYYREVASLSELVQDYDRMKENSETFQEIPADRSIFAMIMTMDGEPFSDRFRIHIRGVATRTESNDLTLDFGVFCEFTSNSKTYFGGGAGMFAGQIYDIAVKETKRSLEELFEHIKIACGAQEVDRLQISTLTTYNDLDEEGSEEDDSACRPWFCCVKSIASETDYDATSLH